MPVKPGHAREALDAEREILDKVERRLDVGRLEHCRLAVDGSSACVDVDGVSADESVLVEVFAHQGPLKAGQRHKVATDALKLITLAKGRVPTPRLVLAFADPEGAKWTDGQSWLAAALKVWGIEVVTVKLDARATENLRLAQVRQMMVSPSDREIA